jgi:hypothetical protein
LRYNRRERKDWVEAGRCLTPKEDPEDAPPYGSGVKTGALPYLVHADLSGAWKLFVAIAKTKESLGMINVCSVIIGSQDVADIFLVEALNR